MKQKTRWHDALVLAAVLCAAFLIVTGTQQITGRIDGVASMVFVLAVFLISIYTDGYVWGVVASLIGVLAVNFAFRSPYFAFNFTLPENLFSGMAMLVVSIMTSTLTTRIKKQEQLRMESETEKMRATLLRAVSHDLRTPINGIRGMVEVGDANADDLQKQTECRSKIWTASGLLLDLANEALDMSRLESGQVDLNLVPTNLVALNCEVRDILERQAEERLVTIICDQQTLNHPYARVSVTHLKRLLLNIAGNAVKYNRRGGYVRLVCREVEPADGVPVYEYTIADNGIGMSEEFQKHIFEQFARERTSTVSKIQGTGLGLSITKSLVDMMGGRITVESEPGRGSEFTISLRFPVGEAKAGQMIPVSKASDFTGKKLLVVEDNELNLEIASTLLEEAGFEVDTAGNGKIAVEKVEAASAGRYDLILMDVQMPEMDGYEATRRIRALPDKKKAAIPIVAMTANAFEEDQKNALNAGMNGHIAKPLDIQKLFQVLSELLK